MNKFIISFWNKSKIQIDEDMSTKLKEAISKESIKSFTIGDSWYAIGGVEAIIPKEEAYIAFPEDNEYLQRLETRQPKFQPLDQDNNQKRLS